MRMLVVEDEDRSVRELEDALASRELAIDVTVAGSRKEALEVLSDGEFDFVVCNLHIPAEPGGVPSLEHGLAVYETVADSLPGTPTMLLTGSGDERAARERIAARPPADIFGVDQPYPMTDLLYKHESADYAERIAEVATQLDALAAIEIQPYSGELALNASQERALRIFARRHRARRIEVMLLGGLSESLALRATLFTEGRDFIAAVFAKLGALDVIGHEAGRYRAAALRLPAGSYAPLLETVTAGAGRTGGLFYGLAERHQHTLFGNVVEDPEGAAAVVEHLREVLGAWRGDRVEPEEILVTTLRRERAPSADIEPFVTAAGDEWRTFEKQTVAIRRVLQHGDLHGGNVLIGDETSPLLIDFANVEELPACFDPIVLELSLVFHPESPFRAGTWPSVEQCEHWDDLDRYIEGCPAPSFVRACRAWALEEAAAPEAAYAVAYAEALRQLRFASSETERALGIARATARRGLALLEVGA